MISIGQVFSVGWMDEWVGGEMGGWVERWVDG